MKPALLFACLATGICPALHAEAASAKSLWPTQADKALCDPIFARLAQQERSPQMAQAQSAPKQTAQDGGQEKKPDEGELATQLSAMLQACSYDGKALKIDPKALAASVGAEGAEAVDSIMRFTGLPQNFKIMESDVPNAAAMIVLGRDGIPQRVIAYNRQFMQRVRRATDEDDWSSISIMAHEIGHHLSGHTLVPGGSQPPIELEADTFSGFVLFKMGAALPDAQKAIAALVPEADGPTHPGRKKRLSAVEAGWTESCRQQQDECDDSVTPVAAAAPPAPVRPTPMAQAPAAAAGSAPAVPLPDIPGAGAIAMPKLGKDGAIAGAAIQPAQIDRMPRLDLTATPSKFNRFVYDTVGVFDPAVKEKLSQTAFQFAAATNVEIVTIVADDLQGRPADQYALDAMRRLRVGKLDVGNGAVLVISPATKQVGVALGAGLLVQYDNVEPLRGYLKGFLDIVGGGGKPQVASRLIADASYRIMRDTKSWEWIVRFNSLDEMQASAEKARADREKSGAPYDPNTDPTWRKLLRIDATVVSTAPDMNDPKLDINEPKTRHVGPAMHVRTAKGKDAVLYVNRNVPALMPVKLEEGKTYAFISRDSFLAGDTPQFDLISYDLLD